MNTGKPRIFIASGSKALPLARAMKQALDTEYCEADIWNETSYDKAPISGALVGDYDFAVVILSREDMALEGDNRLLRQARENCIYEFGVFMSSLGLDRCFLVSGAGPEALPPDLREVRPTTIVEPVDLQDTSACSDAVRSASEELMKMVKAEGLYIKRESLPVLQVDEVMRIEKPKSNGGLLDEGVVVVCDSQPPESYEFAIQIKDNMDRGVSYIYFFPAGEEAAGKICWLLQVIVLADLCKDSPCPLSFSERGAAVKENSSLVLKILQEINDRDILNFYFTPYEPAFEFRIHNASSPVLAKAYLRYGAGFVEWVGGIAAASIYNWTIGSAKPSPEALFNSSVFYDLADDKAASFRASLDRQLKKHFPGVDEEVKRFCYGRDLT